MRWYAVAHPGLEGAVADELAAAGHAGTVVPGGVRFEAPLTEAPRLVPWLRTPDRLLVELAEGPVHSLDELTGLARRADWAAVLHPQAPFEVAASAKLSRVHLRGPIEGRTAAVLLEARRRPFPTDRTRRPAQTQRIAVRIDHDRATLSIDAGGDLLHRRGWRLDPQRAPLRENLAAAVLRLAGWAPGEPLVDPFCGSGTFPIEAALRAAGQSPFVGRAFPYEEWPTLTLGAGKFGAGRDGRAAGPSRGGGRGEAPRARGPAGGGGARRPAAEGRPSWVDGPVPTIIVAADRDPRTVDAAMGNARRARVDVGFRVVDVAELEPPAADGLLVANPPWGERVAPEAAGSVYARFGRAWRERWPGWRVVFLAPDPALARQMDRRVRALATFTSGGTKVGVWAVGD